MTTIKIKFESAEDLRKQLAALGFVPVGESVETLKGGDLKIVLDRATQQSTRGEELTPEELNKETYSDPATDTSASDQADTAKAEAEEAPKRKRRSKADVEAEKAALEKASLESAPKSAAEPDDVVVAPENDPEPDTDEDDDDLTGEDDAPAITIDTLREMVKERVSGGKKPEVIACLTKFGAAKLPNLDEAKYAEFYAELSKI